MLYIVAYENEDPEEFTTKAKAVKFANGLKKDGWSDVCINVIDKRGNYLDCITIVPHIKKDLDTYPRNRNGGAFAPFS